MAVMLHNFLTHNSYTLCLQWMEKFKTHLEENVNAFSPVSNMGYWCTGASCGQNEYYNLFRPNCFTNDILAWMFWQKSIKVRFFKCNTRFIISLDIKVSRRIPQMLFKYDKQLNQSQHIHHNLDKYGFSEGHIGTHNLRSVDNAGGWNQHVSLNAHSWKEAVQRGGLKTSISVQPSLIQSL